MGNVVDMPNKAEKKELSYEDLKNACAQLSANYQNIISKYNDLMAKHQELIQNNYFVRLEWLWRVVNSDKFNIEFRTKCEEEFISMMTPDTSEEAIND